MTSSAAGTLAEPQWCEQDTASSPVVLEAVASDFCQCDGKTCRLLLEAAPPGGELRLNTAVLQRLGSLQFSFLGDGRGAYVFIGSGTALYG